MVGICRLSVEGLGDIVSILGRVAETAALLSRSVTDAILVRLVKAADREETEGERLSRSLSAA